MRARSAHLATAMAFCLAIGLFASNSARADCVPDPLRDAAYINGRAPECRSTFGYTVTLDTDAREEPRSTLTFEVRRSELPDRIPPWLFIGGYNRPAGPTAPERGGGLRGKLSRADFGLVYRERF